MRCSTCQRSAVEAPASIASSSFCASSSWRRARSSSIFSACTASSTSAIARSCSTWKKPGPVANSRISVSLTCTRVEPAFRVAISGAWRASTPISPAAPGTTIISTAPSNAGPSGVTSETSNFLVSSATHAGRFGLCFALVDGGILRTLAVLLLVLALVARHAPSLLHGGVNSPDHVEGLLRKLVVLALEDLLEALDRVLELDVLARGAGELLGDEVRLRKEALDLARARHHELVLVRELVDAEDRDDVL